MPNLEGNGGEDLSPSEGEHSVQRRAFWKELGVDVPEYLSEEEMPPVEKKKLVALEEESLEAAERATILGYIARYRSWADAYLHLLADRRRSGKGDESTPE